jgi:hypothetical protein
MTTRIQIRRDTSIAWETNNPVLALGEPGLETDTFIVKYGDGSTAWNSLPYANLDSLSDFTTADLAEGSRLYYTNARVYANITVCGFATNAQLASYPTNATLTVYATNSQIATYATLSNVASKANVSDLTTANVVEVSNQYFTNARVNTYLSSPTTAISLSNVIVLPKYTYDDLPTTFVTSVGLQGAVAFDTSNNVFRGWNGSTWNILG